MRASGHLREKGLRSDSHFGPTKEICHLSLEREVEEPSGLHGTRPGLRMHSLSAKLREKGAPANSRIPSWNPQIWCTSSIFVVLENILPPADG